MFALMALVSVTGFVDLTAKGLAIMLITSILAALMWRASAAWRHLT